MKRIVFVFTLLFLHILTYYLTAKERQNIEGIKSSVVKIYTTVIEPFYYTPWQTKNPYDIVGSGVIIENKKILTNAHIVSNATFIQLKRAGKAKKYIAKVKYIAHDCDLALLDVEDDSFFDGVKVLSFGTLPKLRDKVSVYGFPKGGEELCITEGVISRIEHRNYRHSFAYLFTCQMDAAINPGSSGGPVVKDGKIVGIAFQMGGGENISYMIPVTLIERFLKDVSDGKYDGIPDLAINWQKMENPDLRKKYKLLNEQTGILVTKIYPVSSLYHLLKPDDVILAIDNINIDNDGTIEFRKGERTNFLYLVQNKQLGDEVKIKILREGKVKEVNFKTDIAVNSWRLVPNPQYDVLPEYYIFGGIVFVPLTYNLIDEWSEGEAPVSFYYHYYYSSVDKQKKQIVVLLKVLADEVNLGYQDYRHRIVTRINRKQVSCLKDLINECEHSSTKYIEIELEEGDKIVLDRDKCIAARDRILKNYKVTSDRFPG